MTVEGVDYAWARPSPVSLAAAGKRFACRYLSNSWTGKNLSRTEAEALSRAGVAVVSNWEWRAGDGLRGYDAGVTYAREAQRQAVACGMPAGRPIYFSVDWDATDAELQGPVTQYLRGVASVLGADRVGVYGGYRTIAYADSHGLARWLWQTYAWSAGRWHPAAHIRQYRNGVTVAGASDIDLDRAMVADYGQWTTGSGPAVTGDDDMTPEQAETLRRIDTRVTTMMYATPTNVWIGNNEESGLYKLLKAIADKAGVDAAELTQIEDAAKAGAAEAFAEQRDAFVAQLVAALPQDKDGTLSVADVEQAVRAVFADAGTG